jgi:hypothetical protein
MASDTFKVACSVCGIPFLKMVCTLETVWARGGGGGLNPEGGGWGGGHACVVG